jgi:hypothetical protein
MRSHRRLGYKAPTMVSRCLTPPHHPRLTPATIPSPAPSVSDTRTLFLFTAVCVINAELPQALLQGTSTVSRCLTPFPWTPPHLTSVPVFPLPRPPLMSDTIPPFPRGESPQARLQDTYDGKSVPDTAAPSPDRQKCLIPGHLSRLYVNQCGSSQARLQSTYGGKPVSDTRTPRPAARSDTIPVDTAASDISARLSSFLSALCSLLSDTRSPLRRLSVSRCLTPAIVPFHGVCYVEAP